MALILHEVLPDRKEFAVWKIEESDDFYLQKLILSPREQRFIDDIKHPAQKSRWLASRYLLKYLMRTDAFVELLADEQGKPYIKNFKLNISISHSNKYAAVFISENCIVGIDVEESSRNISILKNKFLSEKELRQIKNENMQKELLIYWAAKEVMYKMYAKRKLEFKDDMYIHPFELDAAGELEGVLKKNDEIYNYKLNYLQDTDFTLVTGFIPAE